MQLSDLADGQMPVPYGISKKYLEDERFCKRYGQITIAYDPTTYVGGIYHIGKKEWVLWFPISPGQYAERIDRALSDFESKQMAEIPDNVN